MGTSTRRTVMQLMADALSLRVAGTLTSAAAQGTSSFVDTARTEADDFCQEGFVLTDSGTGSGQEQRIEDFANASNTGTIHGTWASALSTDTVYSIYLAPITPAMYRAAINTARSKLLAHGVGRRAIDYTLQTSFSQRYALPSVFDHKLLEVYAQGHEWLPNHDWAAGDDGWTLHANASLTNDGDDGERTLKLVATGSGQASQPADISTNNVQDFEFFALIKTGNTQVGARWRYTILDADGTEIVSTSTIGSAVTSTSFTLQHGRIHVPVNGATLRLEFVADDAATVHSQAPNLMRYGDWVKLTEWRAEWDGNTGYLLAYDYLRRSLRLKLVGRRTLESISAGVGNDGDTLSLDEPELAAFLELAMAEVWRQFGGLLATQADTINTEIAKHEREAEKYLDVLTPEWTARPVARTPVFR